MGRESQNRFTVNPFVPEPDAHTRETIRPRPGSHLALSRIITVEDLSVVFQPIVHIHSLTIFAYEALTRCAVAEYENPMKLFERAVRDGCCGRLGRTIREVAIPLCEGVPVFLNIHPLELEERWLVRPDDPLYFHDRTVFLEITEAVPLSHFDLCKSVLTDIRKRVNARLVVDDLGAGYSNLMHISELEPSVVKLDRALIVDIDRSQRRQTLVKGIVRLCADLGAQVVAEGIEKLDELRALRDAGVDFAQGYLLARPGYPLPRVAPLPL